MSRLATLARHDSEIFARHDSEIFAQHDIESIARLDIKLNVRYYTYTIRTISYKYSNKF